MLLFSPFASKILQRREITAGDLGPQYDSSYHSLAMMLPEFESILASAWTYNKDRWAVLDRPRQALASLSHRTALCRRFADQSRSP